MNTINVTLSSGDIVQITLSVQVLPAASVPTRLVDESPIVVVDGQTVSRSLAVEDQYGNSIPTPADELWTAVASGPELSVSVSGGQLHVTGNQPGDFSVDLTV